MKVHYGLTLQRRGFQASASNEVESQVAVTLPMYYDITSGYVGIDEAIEEVEAFIEQAQAMLEQLKGLKK